MDEESLVRALQIKQLIILKEIVRLCEANDIRYYLGFGSCLGAIRHKGFIPWDDDVDVLMPYPDMVKFENICANQLDTDKFFYQTPRSDSEFGMSICRMRLNRTTLLEKEFVNNNVHTGIFVDIYPLYGAAPTSLGRFKQVIHAMVYCLFLLNKPVKNHGFIMKLGSTVLLKIFTNEIKKKISSKNFKRMSQFEYDKSKKVVGLHTQIRLMKKVFPVDVFGKGAKVNFEDMKVMVPVDYDQYLTICYGNYMQLPPIDQRVMHHEFEEIDFDKGNEEYIKLAKE